MPIAQFTPRSTKFLAELKTRVASLRKGTVAYRVRVPEDLKFWYWLEWGSAGRQDAGAPYQTEHAGTYPIDPVNKHVLRFPDASAPGGMRFAFHVDHPGIRPRLIYRGSRAEILEYMSAALSLHFLDTGFRLGSLRAALMDTEEFAIDKMGAALDAAAPNTRADGRIDGETAGSVWRSEAIVEQTD